MVAQRKSKIYVHPGQEKFLNAKAKVRKIMAGRAWGKTTLIGDASYDCMSMMPGSKGAISSTTYAQLLNKSLPEIQARWKQYGLIEDLHYVVCIKPPKRLNFKKPIKALGHYKNVISFFNGGVIELLSMDRGDLARGGNFDWLLIDEDFLIKEENFDRVLNLTVRGNREYFGHCHLHHSIWLMGSSPWKPSGQWTWKFEELMKQDPDLFYFQSGKTIDNIAILGPEFMRRLKLSLPPIVYAREVDNAKILQLPDGYYPKFNGDRHTYFDSYEYQELASGIRIKGHRDVNRKKPIDFTVDFGGKINVGLAIQSKHDWASGKEKINVLKEFTVQDDQKLRALVNKFCDHFEDHLHKHVNIYGEPRGNDRQADGAPYFVRMQQYFDERGWNSDVMANLQADDHLTRHNIINEIFAEVDHSLPMVRINSNNCEYFIIVLQTTGIRDDFKKDKRPERDESFDQKKAPHLGDAFDNYLSQKFPYLFGRDDLSHLPNEVSFF